MKQILSIVVFILGVSILAPAQTKPDYSGVWKLKSIETTEILTIEHREPTIILKYKIEDQNGSRSFEVKAQIDGKGDKQQNQGSPATFIAKWEGGDLTIELKRNATFGLVNNRRTLKLSKDGKTITTQRIDYSPEATEIFRRPEVREKQ